MIDKNKSPNQRNDLFAAPKKCKRCNEDIKKENLLRNSGYCGYQKICRICKNKDSLKYSRRKQAIIKNNPIW